MIRFYYPIANHAKFRFSIFSLTTHCRTDHYLRLKPNVIASSKGKPWAILLLLYFFLGLEGLGTLLHDLTGMPRFVDTSAHYAVTNISLFEDISHSLITLPFFEKATTPTDFTLLLVCYLVTRISAYFTVTVLNTGTSLPGVPPETAYYRRNS